MGSSKWSSSEMGDEVLDRSSMMHRMQTTSFLYTFFEESVRMNEDALQGPRLARASGRAPFLSPQLRRPLFTQYTSFIFNSVRFRNRRQAVDGVMVVEFFLQHRGPVNPLLCCE